MTATWRALSVKDARCPDCPPCFSRSRSRNRRCYQVRHHGRKFPGDLVYVLGETRNELGGSEYYQMMGHVGLNVPKVRVEEVWPLYLALHRAIQEGWLASCHAVTRGGLALTWPWWPWRASWAWRSGWNNCPEAKRWNRLRPSIPNRAAVLSRRWPPKTRHGLRPVFPGSRQVPSAS